MSGAGSVDETEEFRPRFGPDGLLPVVAQADDGTVLMLAWANEEALSLTLSTGEAHYWSRSRQEIWRKGATSGNTQAVEAVLCDCDQDALLYRVRQNGPACHTGRRSCFYRMLTTSEGGVSLVFTDPS
ncbi:phosphoribosyl-AMP cyclohydrolase [Parvularcula dongshanensis]|uniref:Phosphoribosyl-AMP cyclohydrolase n=1 Tax=Parvularcula dongshanensis TaxID=1173995 RepID=A0A840I050_9PROT|nr:phosphoribosyl-AMP cyclohydrolase [Parvularcula dongshanensis]